MLEVAASASVVGGLTLTKKCGDTTCPPYTYCSPHSSSCDPCAGICELNSNNFDQPVCESQCQDYIHDKIKHYSSDADFHKATRDLQGTIENLRNLTAASLSLSLLLLIIMVSVGGFIWLRHRRKLTREQDLIDKKMASVNTIVNNNAGNEPKLPSSGSNTAAPSVFTEVTDLSPRRPGEDMTLEYAAYDNQGMTPSPVIRDPRDETLF
ncbi:Hypothetical protein NTJ_13416 [Nesidiocoris tenuis]|uniref:TNFR-Cys domain-containing protein n=1 Tax=Nesidiocoris tenuis TaxID=355587 RepID=A0ABN7B879_9HEMI|nr:Hypothetical protein NTJ_13416 [Nesidiocoris tenuis]